MSAFNDYCIVCDQLIPQQVTNNKDVPTSYCSTKTKKGSCNVDRLLYCSEECQLKDKTLLNTSLDSLDIRKSSGSSEVSENSTSSTLDDTDSLIKSPLLLPMDPEKNCDDDASIYCLMNMESSNTVAIPRSSLETSATLMRRDLIFDHIAENNYKLWLNQHD